MSASSETFNVSPLQVADYHRGFLQLLEQLTTVDTESFSIESFASQMSKVNSEVYVIRQDDKVIATAALLIEHKFIHGGGSIGHIEDVVVDRNYRGNGLGRIIIDYLTARAEEKGCYKVILDCGEHNVPFYKNCGFTQNGVEMRKNL